MGMPKGLMTYNGKPWIIEQLLRYQVVDKAKVFIGLGYDYDLYFEKIPWLKDAQNNFYDYQKLQVKTVINKNPQFGPFSTLLTVLQMVEPKVSVLIQPVDVPLLDEHNLEALINCENKVVIPNYKGKNGHPVKLHPEFWNQFLKIKLSDSNVRLDKLIKILPDSSVSLVNVSDKSVNQNINTLKEWKNYIDFKPDL
jgi:molybdopterin-guanine dinucleotide biosynthesis protein A